MPSPVDNPYYDRAYDFYNQNLKDSAFFNFSRAKDLFVENNDSLNAANCLIVMAIIQKDQGDFFGAQETAVEAVDYLDKENPKHHVYLSTNYNNLGAATSALGDKDKAITFYNQAIKFSSDSALTRTYLNNLGRLYQDKEEYPLAISLYRTVLKNEKKGTKDFARVLTNYATAMWQYDKSYNPLHDFTLALNIRKQQKDLLGQNSSYAHFADYYEKINRDSSLYFARKQYQIANRTNRAEDRVKALKRLIRLNPMDSVTLYFARYQQLIDSIQLARTAAKNQFALIRYEVEKNKADNLRLQKENAEKASRLTRQRAITGSVSLLFLVATVGGSFWYRKRRLRLELETQNKIKASLLKTSRKVHDVVANGIYRVMTEIEYKDKIDREKILDRLEDMYHKSRDISYEAEEYPSLEKPVNQQITDLLKSFASDKHRVLIAGNEAEIWQQIDPDVYDQIKHVLQELMVNMKKHSQAEHVVIRFSVVGADLYVYYKDDGIGFPVDVVHGNGLSNTGNRINNIGGKINFVSEPGKGLKVEVIIPTR